MTRKILVTTASGKVGQEVAKLLLAAKVPVRIAARNVEKAKSEFPGAEISQFDFADPASVARSLAGISAVYLASPGDAPAAPEETLIELAKAAGVKKIVKLSVLNAEKVSTTAALQIEKALIASGLDYTILRANWFFQNFTTSMAQAIQSGTLAEPAGDAKTSFIDARDIAAVAVKALVEDSLSRKTIELTGPQALSRNEVTAALSKAIGKPVSYFEVTDAQFRDAVKAYLPASYVELLSQLYSIERTGAYQRVTNTVEEVLGRPPRSFEAFAKEHANQWK